MLFDLKLKNTIPRNAVSDEQWKIYTKAAVDDGPAELLIMDQIGEDGWGDGVSADSVARFLGSNQDREINVRINSPGGLVYDGMTIYNNLVNHPRDVTATIEGLAYSAASFIAMAADRVVMHETSDIGIHRASGVAMGNQKDMQAVADWLATIDEHLVDIYADRTGAERDQVNRWLDGTSDGTLFSAKEAYDLGFADEVIPNKKKAARAEHVEKIAATKDNIRNQAVLMGIASRRRITEQLTK